MLSSPYFSPNRADGETFLGYPRTFISLGGAETFVEEVQELADKMERNGVCVSLDVQVRVTNKDKRSRLIRFSIFVSPARRHTRLFGISECISKRWGSGVFEESGHRMGAVSAGLVRKYVFVFAFIQSPFLRSTV